MGRTADMFAHLKAPRAAPRVLMHAIDHGYEGEWPIGHMVCARCGHDASWLIFDTETEIRRGTPCPVCNKNEEVPHAS